MDKDNIAKELDTLENFYREMVKLQQQQEKLIENVLPQDNLRRVDTPWLVTIGIVIDVMIDIRMGQRHWRDGHRVPEVSKTLLHSVSKF